MAKTKAPKKRGAPKKLDGIDPKTLMADFVAFCGKQKVTPSKVALRVFLGITRETLGQYLKAGDAKGATPKAKDISDAIKKAYEHIELSWVKNLEKPGCTGTIFYLKNAFSDQYRDRQEIVKGKGTLVKEDLKEYA